MKRQRRLPRTLPSTFVAAILSLVFVGCQAGTSGPRRSWNGPAVAQPVKSEPWQYRTTPGQTLHTAHYAIHTTVSDDKFLDRLPQVMEGALEQYQLLAPDVKLSDRPMDCYLFAQ